VVKAHGGKVLGAVRVPFNTSDFSSFLLQAQASGAKVIALATAGGDTTNALKQAGEFGLTKMGQKVAALFMNINGPCNSHGFVVMDCGPRFARPE
jgi:branched-chain amino acid transport system substrate-binding protein